MPRSPEANPATAPTPIRTGAEEAEAECVSAECVSCGSAAPECAFDFDFEGADDSDVALALASRLVVRDAK
jgi:hypothetical protein